MPAAAATGSEEKLVVEVGVGASRASAGEMLLLLLLLLNKVDGDPVADETAAGVA